MAWNVVIAGGGFGGLSAARTLERVLPRHSARITLVNDVNFMLYTPLLPGAAAGTLEPRHIVVPLREQLRFTDLRLGTIVGGTPDEHCIQVRLLNEQGRILVDRHMQVQGRDDVWAIGDAAAVPDPAKKGMPSPPTAQDAIRRRGGRRRCRPRTLSPTASA